MTHVGLLADEAAVFKKLVSALSGDLRFEHVGNAEDAAWEFVGDCWRDNEADHVPAFLEQQTRDPVDRTCYMPVEHLTVSSEIAILGLRLLPRDDPRVPNLGPRFNAAPAVGCFAAVDVRGSHYGKMGERAQRKARHVLRVLRIALRRHRSLHDRQLRFRLGEAYAFNDDIWGFQQGDEVAYDGVLTNDMVTLVTEQAVSRVPLNPTTDAEKKADVALRWIERAMLTGEPLVALLYLFFALEGLVGDQSEGLKAHRLAFRKTMLGHVVEGRFAHPNVTYLLYGEIRSAAVHGGTVPDVDWDLVQRFAAEVRDVLTQYLTVIADKGFTKRSQLLRYLDQHPDRPQLVAWFREGGGDVWTKYLDQLERPANLRGS